MRIAISCCLLLLAATSLWPQTPRFEVAVIKPAPGCALGTSGGGKLGLMSPGRIQVECATMWNLIGGAYAVDEHLERRRVQLEGGPGWLRSETYSVTAKSDDGNASVQMMMGPMMRALLEERLALKTHAETRQGPVYELTAAKGGLKARPATSGACVPLTLDARPQDLHSSSATYKNCGIRNLHARAGNVLEATSVAMNELARALPLDRETFDKTGIEGRFDFVLRYSPAGAPAASADSSVEPYPEIFTAIVEQLGLKIVPARGPVQFLIIDSVQKPTGN